MNGKHGDHPLTEGVAAVAALSEFPAGKFRARTPDHAPMLTLMQDEESGLDALWLIWEGKGTIIVSGYGSIFTNKLLGRADNARLLANAVTRYVAPGGYVIFDDIHQGAASFYDADAFFADSRLHATLGWIGGLWLLWVLGSTRLPVPPAGGGGVQSGLRPWRVRRQRSKQPLPVHWAHLCRGSGVQHRQHLLHRDRDQLHRPLRQRAQGLRRHTGLQRQHLHRAGDLRRRWHAERVRLHRNGDQLHRPVRPGSQVVRRHAQLPAQPVPRRPGV